MCGIVGAVCRSDVTPLLIEGLQRLEYRGYDSAGLAVIDTAGKIQSAKLAGKVERLRTYLQQHPLSGHTGLAHTRWATHGPPEQKNAHPHVCRDELALVHNGIIENHGELRKALVAAGYSFMSETDSEVIVNHVHHLLTTMGRTFLQAVLETISVLEGSYAIGIISESAPGRLIAARHGSPLVIGVADGDYYIASDIFALLSVTHRYIVLEDGDVADIDIDNGITIYSADGTTVDRAVMTMDTGHDSADKAGFRHYMLKEIHEQPEAIARTLENCLQPDGVSYEVFGENADRLFGQTREVQIVACGTSYHAGLVAKSWLESVARIPCHVSIASEYRYGDNLVRPGTLFVTISQSGETADTLAALEKAKTLEYIGNLAICNVAQSSMTRASDLVFLTRAGIEIGVASTKAFTAQLTALMLLTLALAKRNDADANLLARIIASLQQLPEQISKVLTLDSAIALMAEKFVNRHHTLYLGRGSMLPIAMEGALKLKEISYIHAEAYAAGELKHGPLALVNEDMPVVVVAPNNALLSKLISNLQEVKARGGELYVFADASVDLTTIDDIHKTAIEPVEEHIAPIVFTVPLQLFAYHVAVLKGADVDQPRNLAKSVTVE